MAALWLIAAVARAITCPNYDSPTPYSVEGLPAEASGLVAARVRDGVWYVLADAGNPAEIYAFSDEDGYLGEHPVSGVANGDWEDLAAGDCPDGTPCLILADIGDNDAVRPTIAFAWVSEPADAGAAAERVAVWEAEYPDGPRDAEAIAVHPCTGAVYLFTKDEAETEVYRLPADGDRGVATLERVAASGAVSVGGAVTGAAWDADGERLVVRTATEVYEWATDPGDPDAHWSTPPRRVNAVAEPQGEAVAFDVDGALRTASEGVPMEGNVLVCVGPIPAAEACTFAPIYDLGCGCAHGARPAPAVAVVAAAWAAARHRRSATTER